MSPSTLPSSVHCKRSAPAQRQGGIALVMALILLLVLTMISVASVQSTSLEEKMSANERDRQLALQSAEAGLRLGESGIMKRSEERRGGEECIYRGGAYH